MKRVFVMMLALILAISLSACGGRSNTEVSYQTDTENIVTNLENSDNIAIDQVAANALDIPAEMQEEILEDMYGDIPEDDIEEFDEMDVEEVKEGLDELGDKYEVGEPFSEEDQNFFLCAIDKYSNMDLSNNTAQEYKLENVAYYNDVYKISNRKTKCGVGTSYKGSLNAYTTFSGGKYGVDVEVKVTSGGSKVKSMKWVTHHCAYGILGTSGKSPSLGIVYNGSFSSNEYKKSFSVEKQKKYGAILPVYVKTWGTLNVSTASGEYNYGTQTYSTWE